MSKLTPTRAEDLPGLSAGMTANIAPAVEVPDVFTPDECQRIIALRKTLGMDAAPIPTYGGAVGTLREHGVDTSVRATERTHILPTASHQWIFDRVSDAVLTANRQAWQFRVAMVEPLQLLRYPEGGHFDWHSDLGATGVSALRKVSASIMLNAPEEYVGGDFQVLNAGKELTPRRGYGRGVMFPSFQNHRVLPVTRGERYVLIVWTMGRKPFR